MLTAIQKKALRGNIAQCILLANQGGNSPQNVEMTKDLQKTEMN